MSQENRVNEKIRHLRAAERLSNKMPQDDSRAIDIIIAQNDLLIELVTVAINGLYSEDCYIGEERVVYPNMEQDNNE